MPDVVAARSSREDIARPVRTFSAAHSVVLGSVAVNTGIFALWQRSERAGSQALGQALFANTVCSVEHLRRFRFHTLLLSACSHQRPVHFAMNTYGLFLFGNVAAAGLTPAELGSVLTLSAVVASASHCALHPQSPVLGASGALMGLMTTAAFIEPTRRFQMVFPVPGLELSMLQVADLALAVNLGGFLLRGRMPRVAWTAHVGGTAAGLGFVLARSAQDDLRFESPWRLHAGQFVSDWERTGDSVDQGLDRSVELLERARDRFSW